MKANLDLRHYIDFCQRCTDQGVEWYQIPYRINVDGTSVMAHYECPTGHTWTCGWSLETGPWKEFWE